jgi:hypothetical protein
MRTRRRIKTTAMVAGLVAALLLGGTGSALAQTKGGLVDWSKVMSALSKALSAWRLSPFPNPTATSVPIATATSTSGPVGTPTRTLAPSRTPTSTWTASRTPISTRTATVTRTPTSTRRPTFTPTPRPTSTPVPTLSNNGQIAFDTAEGSPPQQKLASAFVVFPYIITQAPVDTRIELMNMSDQPVNLQCFYVRQTDCNEIGFFVSLTANQPLSWSAHDGTSNPVTLTAVPPLDTFGGIGELKCAVASDLPDLDANNVLQGRAIVFDSNTGLTVGYGAVGFQRLTPGTFSGVVDLDGFTYESCPDRLHFEVLTNQGGGPTSSLIVVPCAENLLNQTPTQSVVQIAIINEFEQVFSSSFRFSCFASTPFSQFNTLSKAVLGSDTAHLIVRGVSTPLIGLTVDRFLGQNSTLHTTANEPFLEGGRPAEVIFP